MNPPLNIYLESNPNPNSLKFVASSMLFADGESYDFASEDEAGNSPLAENLFKFDYVSRVFFLNNFVTITKKEGVEWKEIQEELKATIKSYLESGKPLLAAENETNKTIEEESEEVTKIKQILDEYVKPAVESDGGAIIFDSYKEGVVKVQLQGACSGCPSSTLTLKAGIENILKSMMPEIKSVEAESV